MNLAQAVAQLRHLYKQMISGEVHSTGLAAKGLLAPAIQAIETHMKNVDRDIIVNVTVARANERERCAQVVDEFIRRAANWCKSEDLVGIAASIRELK